MSAPRSRGLLDEPLVLDQVEVRHRGGGGERVRGVGVAVAERAARRARRRARARRGSETRQPDSGTYAEVSPLATVMRSGSIPNASRPEPVPEPPEAGDDLVGDQQDVVAAEHLLDRGEVAGRRDDARRPRPSTGSAMNAATVSGPSARIIVSRSSHELLHELGVGHARLGLPQAMGRRRVADHRQRQVEARVHARQAREAGRHDRDAVVAAVAAR